MKIIGFPSIMVLISTLRDIIPLILLWKIDPVRENALNIVVN